LGEDFGGVLGSDFYAAYNDTPGGRHQRCWAHLLRDLHALKTDYAASLEVVVWAKAVKEVYLLAKAWLAQGRERQAAYREAVLLVRALGEQFARDHQGIPVRRWQNGSCAIKTNCSSLCASQECLPTTIWRSGVCVRW